MAGWARAWAHSLQKESEICPYCGQEVPPPKSSMEYYRLIAFARSPDGDVSRPLNGYLTRYRERAREYLEHGTLPKLPKTCGRA